MKISILQDYDINILLSLAMMLRVAWIDHVLRTVYPSSKFKWSIRPVKIFFI
jgi:hypothetical protein